MDQTTALLLQRVVKWGSLAVALSVIIRTLGYTTPGPRHLAFQNTLTLQLLRQHRTARRTRSISDRTPHSQHLRPRALCLVVVVGM